VRAARIVSATNEGESGGGRGVLGDGGETDGGTMCARRPFYSRRHPSVGPDVGYRRHVMERTKTDSAIGLGRHGQRGPSGLLHDAGKHGEKGRAWQRLPRRRALNPANVTAYTVPAGPGRNSPTYPSLGVSGMIYTAHKPIKHGLISPSWDGPSDGVCGVAGVG
jgi:hypothetical protein